MPTSGLDRDQMQEMEEIVSSLEEDNRSVSSSIILICSLKTRKCVKYFFALKIQAYPYKNFPFDFTCEIYFSHLKHAVVVVQ